VTTTLAKAMEVRKLADRLISMSKQGSVDARRRIRAYLDTDEAHTKVSVELAGRYMDQQGGYTRVTRSKRRSGDGAQLAVVEFVPSERSKTF